ncbi:MAG: sigma-70 family RNA polymerase sigma factor [Eubacteriales bacterium]|nr:sigma-70 family RNA polymerase sigma factor [Eubacteriales bacterium]
MADIIFNKQHFDELYNKYASIIFKTAYNYLLNKEDAEDILQEVFFKYFTHNKHFKDGNHEKAWLLRVTANLCKNALRSKSRHNLQLNETIKIGDYSFENESDSHIDLLKTMYELTENQRVAIYLFYYEQIPIKEIAKIMNSNENTVKSHLLRAKDNMKKYLEKE